MLDGTYAGLQASVADFLNRKDLTAVTPDFIAMAEAQISRRFVKDGPIRDMLAVLPVTANAEFIATPADFMGVKAFYLGTSVYAPLQFIEPEKLVERKTLYLNAQGDPQFYSIVGGQFQFWPWNATPGTYSASLSYWQHIPALSNGAPSNWLLTKHPDVYLYTALVNSARYLKDDAALQGWSALADAAINDVIAADKMIRLAPQMQATMIVGGVNDAPRMYP